MHIAVVKLLTPIVSCAAHVSQVIKLITSHLSSAVFTTRAALNCARSLTSDNCKLTGRPTPIVHSSGICVVSHCERQGESCH